MNDDYEEEKEQLTAEHQQALYLLEHGRNIQVTGPAGSGKSFFLRKVLRVSGEHVLQCGTTGVSALQLPNGCTLHSTLKIPLEYLDRAQLVQYYKRFVPEYANEDAQDAQNDHNVQPLQGTDNDAQNSQNAEEDAQNPDKLNVKTETKPKTNIHTKPKSKRERERSGWIGNVQKAEKIIIDEVSMLSAYMLEVVDVALCVLRNVYHKPFGGLQVVFVGDFAQLPPVYNTRDKQNLPPPEQGLLAFESSVWTALDVQVVYFSKVFRQEDPEFAALLNNIRNAKPLTIDQKLMLAKVLKKSPPNHALRICYTRAAAQSFNTDQLQQLINNHTESTTLPFPYHTVPHSTHKDKEKEK
jgi:hypothetical protein